MQQSIASLFSHLDTEIAPWESLDSPWQDKIKNAISSSPPGFFLAPTTGETLAEIVKIAHQQALTIMPCGGGSKLGWGGLVKAPQLVVSTAKLNRIVEHSVGDLTVTVEAGVKLADLQQSLKQVNQFLPLEVAYPESATIGGVVATADSGSWRQRYGGVRDMVLGLSFVRSDGEVAKAGGKVVKNVAGYDLMKLFTGSYGTLGIVSQVTFRVYPLPQASGTVVLGGDRESLAKTSQMLLNSTLTPTAANLLSAPLMKTLALGEAMGLVVRFQSIEESVKEQIAQTIAFGEKLGLKAGVYRGQQEVDLWQQLSQTMTRKRSNTAITCKMGILGNKAANALQRWEDLTKGRGLGMIYIGSGLGRLYLDCEKAIDILRQMRSYTETYQGFLTLLESTPSFKQEMEPWGYRGNALTIMARIKQKFDPKNILNPSRFVDGI
jgi:glycolate oxidase FAD binding subunit